MSFKEAGTGHFFFLMTISFDVSNLIPQEWPRLWVKCICGGTMRIVSSIRIRRYGLARISDVDGEVVGWFVLIFHFVC
jgi:hypothetical protein